MSSRVALSLAVALFLLASAAAPADTIVLFEPIGAYQLELDGKVVTEGVKMYHSPEAGAVLLLAPQLPHPIAIVPRNKTVQKLAPTDLTEAKLGALNWESAGQKDAIATFELVDQKPVFVLDGKKVRFLDQPPLLGPRSIEEIETFDPSYRYKAASATPNLVYLDVLESWPDDVVVKIYFSTQCQVCRELMPGILKVVEDFPNPRFKFEFHGMPLPAGGDPQARALGIKDFPTGIVYVAGKEVGRASGHSWRMPPMAIHHALKGIKVDPELLKEASPPALPPS